MVAAKGGFRVGQTAKARTGAAVCSHSQSGHGRLYFFDEPATPSGAESNLTE